MYGYSQGLTYFIYIFWGRSILLNFMTINILSCLTPTEILAPFHQGKEASKKSCFAKYTTLNERKMFFYNFIKLKQTHLNRIEGYKTIPVFSRKKMYNDDEKYRKIDVFSKKKYFQNLNIMFYNTPNIPFRVVLEITGGGGQMYPLHNSVIFS